MDNVAFPLKLRHVPKRARLEQAARMLELTGLAGFLITRERTLLNSPGVYAGIVLVLA